MTTDLTDARVREMLEAATPGPWCASDYLDDDGRGIITHDNRILVRRHGLRMCHAPDFDLMAAAPDLARAYLARGERVAELEAERDRLSQAPWSSGYSPDDAIDRHMSRVREHKDDAKWLFRENRRLVQTLAAYDVVINAHEDRVRMSHGIHSQVRRFREDAALDAALEADDG